MQFKHPELLYALLLLLIPIIVHLFQLRKFEKVAFTNVEFLKSVTIQTRKSSQLKKWLTLITRLLLFAFIILAFAQPYINKTNTINQTTENVIYLDNSFSMQAKGEKGELLKRSVQDLLEAVDENEVLTLFTNDQLFKRTTLKAIKNDLLQLNYSANQLDYNAVVLKGKQEFTSNEAALKNLILVSDFQLNENLFQIEIDSAITTSLVQPKPTSTFNSSIDSIYISKLNPTNIELTVNLNQSGSDSPISVSLYDDDNLIAKSSVEGKEVLNTIFTVPNNQKINGKISIEDTNLQFDNTLFFNINDRSKIKVLVINEVNDSFLDRIFTDDEFELKTSVLSQLNYNDIDSQNLIVLNELEQIPISLSNALNAFMDNGGFALIIPSDKGNSTSYNQFFTKNSSVSYQSYNTTEKQITTINYDHPLFNDVFNKQISNFQYPKIKTHYYIQTPEAAILKFEDNAPFLVQSGNLFVFAGAINIKNSNFTDSPLIVPTLYNIGRQSLKLPKLYYTIGQEVSFDVQTQMQQDAILKLTAGDENIIPQQRVLNHKVNITTSDTPSIAATYAISNNNNLIQNVSYNYNRNESNLNFMDVDEINNIKVQKSIPELFDIIKSDSNINVLWKWFVIFAMVFLIIEMLILKYFK